MEGILRVQQALHQIYNEFNNAKFQNTLPPAVITILSGKEGLKKAGHCTVQKVWDDDGELKYEIAISAYELNQPFEFTCDTILHEQCHLMNLAKGISDTSKTGNHNKKFKESAEQLGMIVEKSSKGGWSNTSLGDDLKDLVDTFEIDKEAFTIFKVKPEPKEKKPKKTSKQLEYACKECSIKFKMKKEVSLICGICHKPYEVIKPPEDDEVVISQLEDDDNTDTNEE